MTVTRPEPFLFDGDTIRIHEAEETPEKAVELAAVNLSPQVISVNVIGEVNKPGRVEPPASTPLVQAVMAAGGAIFVPTLEMWNWCVLIETAAPR